MKRRCPECQVAKFFCPRFGTSMPGTGRCLLSPHHPTAKHMGLAICCVLSMPGARALVEDADPHPSNVTNYRTMGDPEWISKFCADSFAMLPQGARPRWLQRFINAGCFFEFTEDLVPPHVKKTLKGVIEFRQALAESLFDTSPMREPALKTVQNILDQIRCAVTRADFWEVNSKKMQYEILKVLDQCEALRACTPHDSWHERVRVLLKCLRTHPTPRLWSTMLQLLVAAELAVVGHCFSSAESNTLRQVRGLATANAADPPATATAQWAATCAGQCARLLSEPGEAGNLHEAQSPLQVDKALHSASEARTTQSQDSLPQYDSLGCPDICEMSSLESELQEPDSQQISSQCVDECLSDPVTSKNSKHSQVKILLRRPDTALARRRRHPAGVDSSPSTVSRKGPCQGENLQSLHNVYGDPQQPEVQSLKQQSQHSDDPSTTHEDFKAAIPDIWVLLGAKHKEPLPLKRVSMLPGQIDQKQHKADGTCRRQHQTFSQSSANEFKKRTDVTPSTTHMLMLERMQQEASALIDTLSELQNSKRKSKMIPRMAALTPILYDLSHAPALLLQPHSLTTLDSLRSSLIASRRELDSRLDKKYMGYLNTMLCVTSRLWHLARLSNLEIDGIDAFRLEEINRLGDLHWTSLPGYVAFETYAAMLKEVDAKAAADDFLTFMSLVSSPIDLQAAKLCLLILLYLEHGHLKPTAEGAENALIKLISRLRREFFDENMTEISLYALPEFAEFCSAYFEADACQEFNWWASVKRNEMAEQDVQLPLIRKLLEYGASSVECLDKGLQLMKLPNCVLKPTYLKQVRLMSNLSTHLSSLESPERIFEDTEVLATLEQTSAFAEACLKECEINGDRAVEYESEILEGTMCRLRWFQILATQLRVTPPNVLKRADDNVGKAWLLKSLWSHPKTARWEELERVGISSKLLLALANVPPNDVLKVMCVKAFLDPSFPPRHLDGLFHKAVKETSGAQGETNDCREFLHLLAVHCKAKSDQNKIASKPKRGRRSTRNAIRKKYKTALQQARRPAWKAMLQDVEEDSFCHPLLYEGNYGASS